MNDYYNVRQKRLVETCERSHQYGIRQSGLSGTLIEDQFITYLREDIKEFKFFNGHISDGQHFSNQYDAIICNQQFAEDNRYMTYNHYINVVPLRFVAGVIEVKKWTSPDFLKDGGNLSLAKQNFENFVDRAIPYFFVALRIHDNHCKGRYYPKNRPADDYCYYFFGDGNSGRRHSSVYPWEDPDWADFENKCPYKGEYERLINRIKSLTKHGN